MSEDELINALIEKIFNDTKPKINFSNPRKKGSEENLMGQGINVLNQKQTRLKIFFIK